jgi:hypothetical protein
MGSPLAEGENKSAFAYLANLDAAQVGNGAQKSTRREISLVQEGKPHSPRH